MVRQCAWCLCLINSAGEQISQAPFPKLYEATHGMCKVCGMSWMEQVLITQSPEQDPVNYLYQTGDKVDVSAAKLVMKLQRHATAKQAAAKLTKLKKRPLRMA